MDIVLERQLMLTYILGYLNNMFEILMCDNCKGEMSIPMGQVSAYITLKKSSVCEHCYERKTSRKDYNFCCVSCLREYMIKANRGEVDLKLD
jgi:hypothetical protein